MKRKGFFVIKLLLFLFCILVFIVASSYFLNITRPLKTTNLIVEGWLPFFVFEVKSNRESLKQYSQVYFSGQTEKFDSSLIKRKRQSNINFGKRLITNGAIYLSDSGLYKLSGSHQVRTITVFSHGDSAFYRFPYIFISIKDSIIGSSWTDKLTTSIKIKDCFRVGELNYFSLYYGNDLRYGRNDRNLYLDSILFDSVSLKSKNDFICVNDNELSNCHNNYPFQSTAHFLKSYLGILGFNNNIVILDTLFCSRNKTLAMAKHVFTSLKQKDLQNQHFNVLSYSLHARRSFMVYSSFFKNKTGIISFQDIKAPTSSIYKLTEYTSTVFDEYASIIGTWFYD